MSRIALAPLAAALALTAAPAAAQTAAPAAPYFSASKTQAILGGESRLAAIMAQQSGQPLRAARRLFARAMARRSSRRGCRIYRPAIAMDRPDVFNSVALPIAHSSLDRRWRKVANGPVGATSAAYASGLAERSAIEKLAAINHYVNARVSFVDDSRQYGVADLWTSAAETLRRGRGDCEDYAIAKLQLLRRAGFAEKDLYLVILRDAAAPRRPCGAGRPRRRPHAGARQRHRPADRFLRDAGLSADLHLLGQSRVDPRLSPRSAADDAGFE